VDVFRRKEMATLKRLEKRVNEIESWVKDYENGTGPSQTMDNLNFLVGQTRMLAEQMQGLSNQNQELNTILQSNHAYLEEYLEKEDMVISWQSFLETKNKEEKDALQKQEAESLDVQEQAKDGKEVGEGDA
jgi:hypothetical protein|tara:strand:- start:1032 stop:1424 length:393 start_codon:yes stop_codon:yes gene_type:complete